MINCTYFAYMCERNGITGLGSHNCFYVGTDISYNQNFFRGNNMI